jgi:hypothetical protein
MRNSCGIFHGIDDVTVRNAIASDGCLENKLWNPMHLTYIFLGAPICS